MLYGKVEAPAIKLEYDVSNYYVLLLFTMMTTLQGDLYFMPTCVHCNKDSQLSIMNLTSLQLDYHWRLSEEYNNVLSVSPLSGTLLPNETQV